jgi:hypothetical protein
MLHPRGLEWIPDDHTASLDLIEFQLFLTSHVLSRKQNQRLDRLGEWLADPPSSADARRRYAACMRNLLFGVLGSAMLVTACSTMAPGSPGRPNSVSAMQTSQQDQPKDPHDFVRDPTIGSDPPRNTSEKPICHLQCSPNTHCDNSGFVERCVRDEEQKP